MSSFLQTDAKSCYPKNWTFQQLKYKQGQYLNKYDRNLYVDGMKGGETLVRVPYGNTGQSFGDVYFTGIFQEGKQGGDFQIKGCSVFDDSVVLCNGQQPEYNFSWNTNTLYPNLVSITPDTKNEKVKCSYSIGTTELCQQGVQSACSNNISTAAIVLYIVGCTIAVGFIALFLWHYGSLEYRLSEILGTDVDKNKEITYLELLYVKLAYSPDSLTSYDKTRIKEIAENSGYLTRRNTEYGRLFEDYAKLSLKYTYNPQTTIKLLLICQCVFHRSDQLKDTYASGEEYFTDMIEQKSDIIIDRARADMYAKVKKFKGDDQYEFNTLSDTLYTEYSYILQYSKYNIDHWSNLVLFQTKLQITFDFSIYANGKIKRIEDEIKKKQDNILNVKHKLSEKKELEQKMEEEKIAIKDDLNKYAQIIPLEKVLVDLTKSVNQLIETITVINNIKQNLVNSNLETRTPKMREVMKRKGSLYDQYTIYLEEINSKSMFYDVVATMYKS